jgi:hypothetical protein
MIKPKKPILINGHWGLGDNIYQRPFVKKLCEHRDVYLDTPWPEIYEDLPIKFVLKPRQLRTQMKNVRRQPAVRWTAWPGAPIETRRIQYLGLGERHLSIPVAIGQHFAEPVNWQTWDLPRYHCFQSSPISRSLPIAVIKVTTVREEWKSASRNPKPEYVNWIASELMKTHFVVAVGDLYGDAEKLVGDLPPHHLAWLKGELVVEQLIDLVHCADIIVGGVGWNVPMSIALKTKSFVVLGGRGAHNAPNVITDPAMDLSRIGFATPKQYCRCSSAQHDCNKEISDLPEQWLKFCERVRLIRSENLPGGQLASATIQ